MKKNDICDSMQINEFFNLRIVQKLRNELNYSWVNSIESSSIENNEITIIVTNLNRVKEVGNYIKCAFRKVVKTDNRKNKVTSQNVNEVDALKYNVQLRKADLKAIENSQFEECIATIRIETMLQHAWGILLDDYEELINGKNDVSSEKEGLPNIKAILRFIDGTFSTNNSPKKKKDITLLGAIKKLIN